MRSPRPLSSFRLATLILAFLSFALTACDSTSSNGPKKWKIQADLAGNPQVVLTEGLPREFVLRSMGNPVQIQKSETHAGVETWVYERALYNPVEIRALSDYNQSNPTGMPTAKSRTVKVEVITIRFKDGAIETVKIKSGERASSSTPQMNNF